MHHERRERRGSYAIMWAFSLGTLMGFGALSLDMTLVEFARGQMQDVSDAAAQAAAISLRETNSASVAETVARRVVEENDIVGATANVDIVQVGLWDGSDFATDGDSANSVRIKLDHNQPLLLAPLFGFNSFDIATESISAWQEVHAILVVDATNSYSQSNFANARAAAVAFYDMFTAAAQPDDRIGLVIFTGQFGVEYTPLQRVEDAAGADVRGDWLIIPTGSKAGDGPTEDEFIGGSYGCDRNGDSDYGGRNDFENPVVGGCYPWGWREYKDENGTDHAAGMAMAQAMFDEYEDVANLYRAVVISTDGQPSGTGAHEDRGEDDYHEDRWRYFQAGRGVLPAGSAPATGDQRNTDEVTTATAEISQEMFVDQDTHIWMVSFDSDASWQEDIPKGNGYYVNVDSSAELIPIYQDIARSFPMVLVR